MFVRPEELNRFKNLNFLARWVVEGFVTGLHRSPYHGASAEFLEYREYTPGDDLRRLDWKVYGRTDRTYVKRYQSETNARAFVFLDCSSSMGYRIEGRDKWFYAKALSACLIYLFQKQGDAAGLLIFSDEIKRFFEARTSARHRNDLLNYLESLPCSGKSNIRGVLDEASERIPPRSICVIISDFYEDPESLASAFRHLRFRKNEAVAFHVLDPTEQDFDLEGLVSMVDLETGERLLVDASVVREGYRRRFKAHCERLHSVAGDSLVEHLILRTDRPFGEALAFYLYKRLRRKA